VRDQPGRVGREIGLGLIARSWSAPRGRADDSDARGYPDAVPFVRRQESQPESHGFGSPRPVKRSASPRERAKIRRAQGRRIRAAIVLGRPVRREDTARALAWANTAGDELKTAIWSVLGMLALLPVGAELVPNVWFGVAWAIAFSSVAFGFFFLLRLRAWGKAQARQKRVNPS
jgi:hypothetical protein